MESPSLTEKLMGLLRQRFQAPAQIQLQYEDGIIGKVTSEEFRGLKMIDRVNLIWDFLDSRLSLEENRKIAIIVPQAPGEVVDDEEEFIDGEELERAGAQTTSRH